MMQYKRYKPLSELWLSSVPEHWEIRKIKYLFSERSEKGYPDEPLLVASQNMGVVPKGVYGNRTVEAMKDLQLLKLVRVGDFVISLRSFQGGIEYAYYQGIISPAYTIMIPKVEMTAGYFRYLAKSRLFIELLQLCVTGIREGQNVDYSKLKNHRIPVPPREEQDQIVRYLDWQVSKINKLIAAKKRQIKLLEEHRASMLDDAVTHGIRKNRMLKPSGMKWLPNIPSDWSTIPAKALFSNKKELRRPDDEMLAATQKYGIISQRKYMELQGRRIVLANDGLDKWLHVDPDDFVISLRSFQGGLERCAETGCVTWHYVVLQPNSKVLPVFYRWLFKSPSYIAALQHTSDFIRDGQDLRYTNFIKVRLVDIPIEEQTEIAAYLDEVLPKYDAAIELKEGQISVLHDLRTRLISDVVTGQMDVRGIEVPDFEMVEELGTDDSEPDESEAAGEADEQEE